MTFTLWRVTRGCTLLPAIALSLVMQLAGCSKKDDAPQETAEAASELKQALQKQMHAYDFQDGMEYGYTAAVTEANTQSGQAGANVTTFMYAGQRDGKYQLHQRHGAALTAIECTVPCDVMKIMIAMDIPGTKVPVNVQRFRPQPNAIAIAAFNDAANGFMKQYGVELNGKTYAVWVDDQKGIVRSAPQP